MVATVVFMVCRYGFGSPVAATYAVFGAIGFGVLSQVVGTPRQRTRTLVGCLVAGTFSYLSDGFSFPTSGPDFLGTHCAVAAINI